MFYRLDPAVLDRAKQVTSATSDEQLGQQFLTKTGSTVRNYRTGKTAPDVVTLMRLREITGIPLDQMLQQTAA